MISLHGNNGIKSCGGMSVGVQLSEEALSHAIHLAFLCQYPGSACTHYEIIPGVGLCLYNGVDNRDDPKLQAFPNFYNADQAVTFVYEWLKSVTVKVNEKLADEELTDEELELVDEEFCQFAGPAPDTLNNAVSLSREAFILGTSIKDVLRARAGRRKKIQPKGDIVFVVRPAWMAFLVKPVVMKA